MNLIKKYFKTVIFTCNSLIINILHIYIICISIDFIDRL